MKSRIAQRLRRGPVDGGMSLIEVLVALMVFTIIALGMSYSLITMQRLAYDTENREVAANVAADEVQRLKAKNDVFHLFSTSTPDVVVRNGTKFFISRVADWQPASGTIAACGTGGGNLLWKFVNISVTWDGMLQQKSPVRADTIIAPDDRVNSPELGTIVVSVRGINGAPRSGIAVSVRDKSTNASIGTLDDTDEQGCTYALQVSPGTYTVRPSKSGYIQSDPVAWAAGTANAPSVDVTVDAGTTKSAVFDYDAQNTFSLNYAPGRPPGNVYLPNSMATTFVTETANYMRTDSGTPSTSVNLYPFTAGYSAIAGAFRQETETVAGCLSPDPASWAGGTYKGQAKADGVRAAPISADPGQGYAGGINVPMGFITVNKPGLSGTTITLTNVASNYQGDPGCDNPQTIKYTVPNSLGAQTLTLAVPYGSWAVYNGAISNSLRLNGGALGVLGGLGDITSGNVVTVDPRANA